MFTLFCRHPKPKPPSIHYQLRRILMNQADVLAKLAGLKTSLDALVAIQAGAADLTPIGNAVDALKAEVDAAVAAATPPAPAP